MTEHEELLILREMVEKQKQALLEKDEIIRKKDIRIENLTQALLHARKKMFGTSSETTQMDGQMSLFDQVQELAGELFREQKKVTVKSHKRTPRKAGVREEMLEALPKEIEEYIIDPEETCDICGGKLKVIGKQIVRTEVEYIEAHLKVKQIVRQIAKCTECGTKESENPTDHFRKAAVPAPLLAHSIATPSLVSHIMYQKFMMGIPLNRQEQDLFRAGLVLPRATMAHWVIRCSEEWLVPVYDRILHHLTQCENLHMDETRIQVNKEPGRKAGSDSWMWVIQSGKSESLRATFFHYSVSRSGDIPRKLLEGFSGYLTTDAYKGYEKVTGITRNLCWSHYPRSIII